MSDNYGQSDRTDSYISHHAIIKVIGVGGGGINAVARMLSKIKGKGVEFWAIDTDIATLAQTPISNRLTLGDKSEWRKSISREIESADIVYIVAGMGGEQGIDAMMVVAEVSKEMGALTVAVVTHPFRFEGRKRCNRAEIGIEQLVSQVDILIAISNDRLLPKSDESGSLEALWILTYNMLLAAVRPFIEVVNIPGIVNVDFADMRLVLADAGLAYFGIGDGEGESRAKDAALQAINSPLSECSIEGARGIVLSITGGADISLLDITIAADTVYEVVDPNANILIGAVVDESMEGKIQVSIIATGLVEAAPIIIDFWSRPPQTKYIPLPDFFRLPRR